MTKKLIKVQAPMTKLLQFPAVMKLMKPGETPAMVAARAARERQALAVAEIDSDERLQALLTRFDGELDRASIAPTDS